MKLPSSPKLRGLALGAAPLVFAASLEAAVTFTVSDTRPGESAVTTPSSTLGSVSSTAAVPTATYTITGLDLTSVGGTNNETIVFDVLYTHGGTGGTGVQINGFGNIAVTGGDNNQVDNEETLTATLSLNGATTFTGGLSLGFTSFQTGGVSAEETWNVITASGTQFFPAGSGTNATFDPSSFVTLDPVSGNTNNGTFNAQAFTVSITAVPEPSASLLGGLGLMLLLRRRRA